MMDVIEMLQEVCAGIVAQNVDLMARLESDDFDAGCELDNTRNDGAYRITDFFDALKLFDHGTVPSGVTDEMVRTTDELIGRIRRRYPWAVRQAIRAGQAFRRSKRVWRIRDPKVPLQPAEYAARLDACREEILDALDALNATLDLPPDVRSVRPKKKRSPRKSGARTQSKSRDWNQAMAAKLLGITTRQLRNYKRCPPDGDWPGWEEPIALQKWKNQRDDREAMHRAMACRLGYKEGFSESKMRREKL